MAKPVVGVAVKRSEMRQMRLAGSVRIPNDYDVGALSLRKQPGDAGWAIQIAHDRGHCTEKRTVSVEDVIATCLVRGSFRQLADETESRIGYEDWNEWDVQLAKWLDGDRIVTALKKSRRKKLPRYGIVFVAEQAPVLTESTFGLPASESVQWQSPTSPAARNLRTGPHC